MLVNITVDGRKYVANELRKAELIRVLELCGTTGEYQIAVTADAHPLEGIPARDLVTTPEWLDQHAPGLTTRQTALFNRRASDLYRKKYGVKPRKIARQGPKGTWNKYANGYQLPQDELLFQEALQYAISKP